VYAVDSGTSVTLKDTAIEDTKPDGNGAHGYGMKAYGGAAMNAESCEVRGNAVVGVYASQSGTTVTLRETIIQDTKPGETTKPGENGDGWGICVHDGANLDAEGCVVEKNTSVGVAAEGYDTSVTLRDTAIRGTKPDEDRGYGTGIQVSGGASLEVEGCVIKGNSSTGLIASDSDTEVTLRETSFEEPQLDEYLGPEIGIDAQNGVRLDVDGCAVRGSAGMGVSASGPGTSVTMRDTRIASTKRAGDYMVGVGVAVGMSASFVAEGIEVSSTEGPGLYATWEGTHLTCSGCTIRGSQFAGAVAVWDATLNIVDSIIAGTAEQENLGGGVGIYAEPWDGGPPTLSVTDTTIQDNAIAGVWLSGQGSYSLSGNTIQGGEGWTRESLTKCGDAVYAGEGVTAWDGSSGLLLENNELLDGLGAGLLLDNASATLSGNSYAGNAVDLVMQGGECETPPDGYEEEAIGSAELCPAYDYATCGDEFALYLTLAEPAMGSGAALLSPGLPDPAAPDLPTLPVALPNAFEPLPPLPPAARLEPLEFRPRPVRFERPQIPLAEQRAQR